MNCVCMLSIQMQGYIYVSLRVNYLDSTPISVEKNGLGRASSDVVGDVWREEHSSVGASARELGFGGI